MIRLTNGEYPKYAVQCEVYANGKRLGLYHDGGTGKEPNFQIHPNCDATRALYAKVQEYVIDLPVIDDNADKKLGKDPLLYQPNFFDLVEAAIDVRAWEDKFRRECKKYILYGTPDICKKVFWKKHSIEDVMYKETNGAQIVQAAINMVKSELKEGERILNAEYLKSLGLTV